MKIIEHALDKTSSLAGTFCQGSGLTSVPIIILYDLQVTLFQVLKSYFDLSKGRKDLSMVSRAWAFIPVKFTQISLAMIVSDRYSQI